MYINLQWGKKGFQTVFSMWTDATLEQKLLRKYNDRDLKFLFRPNDNSGSPTVSLYTLWTEAEVLAHPEQGWGVVTELHLEHPYGPEPKISGELYR